MVVATAVSVNGRQKRVFDCTNGASSLAALRQAGANNLRGKILIQVGNPLDFSKGMPPTLTLHANQLIDDCSLVYLAPEAISGDADGGE